MSDSPNNNREVQAALAACKRSVRSGRYRDAERHLAEAVKHGASHQTVERHASAIRNAENAGHKPRGSGAWWGFAVAAIGYFLLSLQQPAGWGEAVWVCLAFILIPALVGVVVNRGQGPNRPPNRAFFSSAKPAGFAMFLYTSITLMVLAARMDRPDAHGEEFLTGLIVTCVYTLVAAAAAGTVNLMLTTMAARRDNHGPAS